MSNKRVKSIVERIVGGQPSEKAFFKASKSSYKDKAFDSIDGYNKIYDGKTIDAFLNPNSSEILVGVRGTAMSTDDLKADVNIVSNNLKNTTRYKNDVKQMNEIFQQYPPQNHNYYLGGHSLGSAIISQLKRDYPFLKDAVVFNGALQPVDLSNQHPDMKFKYIDKDPLYNIVGKSVKNKEVFPYEELKRGSFFGRIGAKLQPTILKAHKLEQFEKRYGGGRYGKGAVQSAQRRVERIGRNMDIERLQIYANQIISESAGREVNEVNQYYLSELINQFLEMANASLDVAREDRNNNDIFIIKSIMNDTADIANVYLSNYGIEMPMFQTMEDEFDDDEPEGVGAVGDVEADEPEPPQHIFVKQPDGSIVLGSRGKGRKKSTRGKGKTQSKVRPITDTELERESLLEDIELRNASLQLKRRHREEREALEREMEERKRAFRKDVRKTRKMMEGR